MISIQNQLLHFKSLSIEQKKEKLLTILNEIKDTDEIFKHFFTMLTLVPNLNEKALDSMYGYILSLGDALAQGEMKKFEKIKNRLTNIHKQEQFDNEENLENMFSNL